MNKLKLFFAPEGDGGGAPEVNLDNGGDDLNADIDLLSEDDETSPDDNDDNEDNEGNDEEPSDDDSEGNEEEDEDSEEDGEGEEDKGKKNKKDSKDDDEEIELTRHSYRDIKEKYPTLFKDFPGLKQAFYREQEFTKLFPTVEDAQEALAAAENFTGLRDAVVSGDAETFLTNLKEASPESLDDFAGNFLTDLKQVDKEVYYKVTTPVIKNILSEVYKVGVSKKDKNVQNAAILAFQEIFGGDFADIPGNLSANHVRERKTNDDDPDKRKFEQERNQFYSIKHATLVKDISSNVERELTSEIEKGLDPKNAIRPGLKKIIVDKILDEVMREVSKDQNHVGRMTALWERERKQGFNGAFKDSIKTTYLSRAKALVPKIRQRIRTEITAGQKQDDKNRKEKLNSGAKRVVPAGGKPNNERRANSGKPHDVLRGKSDLDFLNS